MATAVLSALQREVAAGREITGGRNGLTVPAHTMRELVAGGTGPVRLDGGPTKRIKLLCEDGALDLRRLGGADGNALPGLVLRNCRIEGLLDLSHSQFASVEVSSCVLTGIAADDLRTNGNVEINDIAGAAVRQTEGAGTLRSPCRIRMRDAAVGGLLAIRACKLKSSAADTDVVTEAAWSSQFALCLDRIRIASALIVGGGKGNAQVIGEEDNHLILEGGASLAEAHIAGSVKIEFTQARALYAHEPSHQLDSRSSNSGTTLDADAIAQSRQRSFAAIDARGATIGGCLWISGPLAFPHRNSAPNLCGRLIIMRANVGGDVVLRDCRWHKQPPVEVDQTVPSADWAAGGVDARYCRVGGQFRIDGDCQIARRRRINTGIRALSSLGPALDLWKADVALGIRVDSRVTFHGPVLLNDVVVGREVYFEAKVELDADLPMTATARGPYHLAFSLAGTRLKGDLTVRSKGIAGRVAMMGLSIDGSAEIEKMAIQYCAEVSNRPPADRNADETSVLDLQDVYVSGGINLKRGAISIEGSGAPPNGFVVDLRGLRADTWDDAEATAFRGMRFRLSENDERHHRRSYRPAFQHNVPWRIRLTGISFARLETSAQPPASDMDLTIEYSWWERMLNLEGAEHRADLLASSLGTPRSYRSLSERETRTLRWRMLSSFHENRYRPTNIGHFAGLKRLGRKAYRWTIEPSWHRRQNIPQFSPQPYEMFARAYLQLGDVDTAIWIARRRLGLHWLRRARAIHQRAFIYYPLAAITIAMMYKAPSFASFALLGGLLAFLLAPLSAIAAIWAYSAWFGFGLSPKRALSTMIAFAIFSGFATPFLVADWANVKSELSEPASVTTSIYYGIDKLLPAMDLQARLFPPAEKTESIIAANPTRFIPKTIEEYTVCASPEIDLAQLKRDRDDQLRYAYETPACKQKLFFFIDRFLDLAGWIILAMSILTFSGLLRRQIER